MEDHEYSSAPLCVCYYNDTQDAAEKDFIFGMHRAKQLSMYWLATGEKPLLENQL